MKGAVFVVCDLQCVSLNLNVKLKNWAVQSSCTSVKTRISIQVANTVILDKLLFFYDPKIILLSCH